ncbi:MAG: tetratricopeptide repeat protein [Candidatus Midichloria sp.]|nr:tetratricopeptide repeat protein [Candidatus Midichloria sp.]
MSGAVETKQQQTDQDSKIQDPNILAEEYFNIGRSLYKLGKYEDAIKNDNLAIKCKPKFADAYNYYKGIILSKLGRYQEAIQNYDLAIRYDLRFAEAYNNKGNSLNKLVNIKKQ